MIDYKRLLLSPRWIETRDRILSRDGRRCAVCHADDRVLEVHHMRCGKDVDPCAVDDCDLVTLCDDCHEKHHHLVKWIQREIVDIPPQKLVGALNGNAHSMADLISEISGRLASLSWCSIREVPLE